MGYIVFIGSDPEPPHHQPTMARTKLPEITTVSEWLAATVEIANDDKLGLTKQGTAAWKLWQQFQVVSAEQVERETEKAIGVKGIRWNACANAKPAIVWLPKSQMRELQNDRWINCAARMFLVPTWLIEAKAADGLELA